MCYVPTFFVVDNFVMTKSSTIELDCPVDVDRLSKIARELRINKLFSEKTLLIL